MLDDETKEEEMRGGGGGVSVLRPLHSYANGCDVMCGAAPAWGLEAEGEGGWEEGGSRQAG